MPRLNLVVGTILAIVTLLVNAAQLYFQLADRYGWRLRPPPTIRTMSSFSLSRLLAFLAFLALLLLFSSWVMYEWPHDPKTELVPARNYIGDFGTYPEGVQHAPTGVFVKIHGELLTEYAERYKIVLVAFHWSGETNIDDTPFTLKSTTRDIESDKFPVVIPYTSAFIAEHVSPTTYVALLIPNGVAASQFSTIRQAKKIGGVPLQIVSGPP